MPLREIGNSVVWLTEGFVRTSPPLWDLGIREYWQRIEITQRTIMRDEEQWNP